MAAQSTIEWTHSTWNPVTGCTKVSAGCKNCYAERMEDVLRLAKKADRPNVGVTFTFCHFLAVDDAANLNRVLRMAKPYLTMVTINGTSGYDPQNRAGWIQTLDEGDYDVSKVLVALRKLDYQGPIGILDHRSDLDAEESLKENLTGLSALVDALQNE